jgi:hypothetical protein
MVNDGVGVAAQIIPAKALARGEQFCFPWVRPLALR